MCVVVAFVLAAAVVSQHNVCSSGVECSSDDKPQHVVTLLQTKLQMNVLEVGSEQKDVMQQAPQEKACNWVCYLARYPDLQNAFGNNQAAASRHYTHHGKAEGRDCTCSDQACNWDCYLARYPDLQNAFGNDQVAASRHYRNHGKAEDRDCTCSEAPTTEAPSTEAPTTEAPTEAVLYTSTQSQTCPVGYRMLSSEAECRAYGAQSVIDYGDGCDVDEASSSSTNNFRRVALRSWGSRPKGCWTEEGHSQAGGNHCVYWSPDDGRPVSYSPSLDQRSWCISTTAQAPTTEAPTTEACFSNGERVQIKPASKYAHEYSGCGILDDLLCSGGTSTTVTWDDGISFSYHYDDLESCTQAPTTKAPTTEAPSTEAPTTEAPTTRAPTTEAPKTELPTTVEPTTDAPTTEAPTTEAPTMQACNWVCYLARYPDLQNAFGNNQGAASRHYTDHGKAEGRDCTCSDKACNWDCYLARYPDLQSAFGNNQGAARRHYSNHGKAEGRDCTCSEAPTTEPPTKEAPTTEAPTTDAPTTEAPATEAPTTVAPTTEAPTTEALWPQLGVDNSRCSKGSHFVPSRVACQSEAAANGHTYYQYQPEKKLCDTFSTCESPITGTKNPWKIYHALWPQLGADNSRCTKGSHVVPSRVACQSEAAVNGHTYYQYQPEKKLCDTVSTCESPITGTKNPWKIYYAFWPQLGADNSRCSKGSHVVRSRFACQAEAAANGHTYYQYQPEKKLCDTASTCEPPITGTKNPWKIYHQTPTALTTDSPTTEASTMEAP